MAEAEIKATPVKRDWALKISNALRSVRDFADKAQIPEGVPLVGGQGLGQLLIGQQPEGYESVAYGMPLTRGSGWTTQLKPEAIDMAMGAVDAIGLGQVAKAGAKPLAKAAAKEINEAMLGGDGVLAKALSPAAPKFIIAGEKAQTADLAKLARAKEIVGDSPLMSDASRQAWSETGWWRGADGKWRFEIPDEKAYFRDIEDIAQLRDAKIARNVEIKQAIKESKEYPDLFPKELRSAQKTLREEAKANDLLLNRNYGLKERPALGHFAEIAFPHDELYKAYPSLKEVVITQGKKGGDGELGMQMGSMIDIYDKALKKFPESTALHEMNHAVQDIEGFARGGNTHDEASMILKALRERYQKPGSPYEDHNTFAKFVNSKKLSGVPNYKRLSGETESRLAQKRMYYSPEERASIFPPDDMDVPFKRQIVREQQGGMKTKDLIEALRSQEQPQTQ